MKKRQLITLILTVIFVVCCIVVFSRLIQYRSATKENAEAQSYITPVEPPVTPAPTPKPTEEPEDAPPEEPVEEAEPKDQMLDDETARMLRGINYTALKAINEDVMGWIIIPGTEVNYPLMQGDDNDFYLDHTWEKNYNSAGSVFLETRCASDLSDFNTIIYGHRMKNRSMFGCLKDYSDISYWEEHPYVYVGTTEMLYKYEIYAAFEPPVTQLPYRLFIKDDGLKQQFLDYSLSETVIDTGIVPTIDTRVLTMSTCTGHGYATRWVVQAALVNETPVQVSPD